MAQEAGSAPAEGAVPGKGKRLPIWLLQGVTLYWITLKLAALFIGEPHADEAYYWLWGQHLSLSYFDHAPLHAWLQGAVSVAFGWNLFSLRILSIVSAAVVLYIIYLWSKRLARDDWRHHFWLTAALFYSTPLMLLSGILDSQYPGVAARYAARGFREVKSLLVGEWRSGWFARG